MDNPQLIGKSQAFLAELENAPERDGFVANEDREGLRLHNSIQPRWVWLNVTAKGARFVKCNFSYSTFVNCYFRGASFEGCDFTGCRFVDCNFSTASMAGCRLQYTRWEKTEVRRSTLLGNLPSEANLAQKVLIQLRLNASSIGEYDDARHYLYEAEKRSRAHFMEIIKCRQDYYRKKYRVSVDRVLAPLRYARSLANQLLWGYGERPLLLSLWGLLLVVGFGVVHSYGEESTGLWAGIKLSLGSFASVVPGLAQPDQTISIWRLLESLLGIVYIAFLAASLHRRVSTRRD